MGPWGKISRFAPSRRNIKTKKELGKGTARPKTLAAQKLPHSRAPEREMDWGERGGRGIPKFAVFQYIEETGAPKKKGRKVGMSKRGSYLGNRIGPQPGRGKKRWALGKQNH